MVKCYFCPNILVKVGTFPGVYRCNFCPGNVWAMIYDNQNISFTGFSYDTGKRVFDVNLNFKESNTWVNVTNNTNIDDFDNWQFKDYTLFTPTNFSEKIKTILVFG